MDDTVLWRARVATSGLARRRTDSERARAAVQAIAAADPFVVIRAATRGRIELEVWVEAPDATQACQLALTAWHDLGQEAGLVGWDVVGLDVVRRAAGRASPVGARSASVVRPLRPRRRHDDVPLDTAGTTPDAASQRRPDADPDQVLWLDGSATS